MALAVVATLMAALVPVPPSSGVVERLHHTDPLQPALVPPTVPEHGAAVADELDDVVTTEVELRAAWADPLRQRIDLGADILLRDCFTGDPIRESPYPLVLDGHGHTLQQTCFEKRLLRQDGTGFLDIRSVTLTRGGSDGPGAALTSRGEIILRNCVIRQNLAEEPGGGVFSMRRVTVRHSRIAGNLANDDGGGVYARRGGVQVYDSVLSNNLVDGSGGAIGSTGDILVVRSEVDGNTTDGDGGALYADEDGDVTVIASHIDGSAADGPGGAIFTLDGDVAVLGSTLIGNRADDRGGAISGEDDVLLVNSTVARNLAIAHAGGGVWARGDLVMINSTVTGNYAEGEGGGVLAAGRTTLIASTLLRNIAPVGGDLGSAGTFTSFASIIGPPVTAGVTGDTIPTERACRVYTARSRGYNFVHDDSCRLDRRTDLLRPDPHLAALEDHPRGFVLEALPGSPVRRRIPAARCIGHLPDPLPAGQLLTAYVDWDEVLRHDALGRPRDGRLCDIGAVQSRNRAAGPRASLWPRWSSPRVPAAAPIRLAGVSGDDRRTAVSPPASVPTPSANRAVRPGPLARLARGLGRERIRLRMLRREVGHARRLRGCITELPLDQAGDRRHRWGFVYDERDGAGEDLRTALVSHRGAKPPDFRLLLLSTARHCLSRAPDPNGAGANARNAVRPSVADAPAGSTRSARRHPPTRRELTIRLRHLERVAARVAARADRFDDWESCLSWMPVTEAGDRAQDLGYVMDSSNGLASQRHLPAIDVDHSEWDDPDYQLLAFLGRDHPGGRVECGSEPGEAVDRSRPSPAPRAMLARFPVPRAGDLDELFSGLRALRENVEDLVEPVQEVTRFDECMFTIGLQEQPGYLFRAAGGTSSARTAWSFDLRGPYLSAHQVLAFPGEEPPQIECNEDAAGENTDE